MREITGAAPPSTLQRVSPTEVAHADAVAQLTTEERERRRDAVLHNLAVARARRRLRRVSRFA